MSEDWQGEPMVILAKTRSGESILLSNFVKFNPLLAVFAVITMEFLLVCPTGSDRVQVPALFSGFAEPGIAPKGWVRAGDLVPGDHLLGEDGQEVAVESIRQTEDYEKVYNLRVADNHTYFVGGDGWGFDVWVHNARYRRIFFEKNPSLKGNVVVHHRIEQQVLTKYKNLFTKEELNALENLRGIPKGLNNQLHNSFIRKAWNRFYKAHPNASAEEIINYADIIDSFAGGHFLPNIGTRFVPWF